MSLMSSIPALLLLVTAAPIDKDSAAQGETTLVRVLSDLETAGGADWTGECLDAKSRSRWTARLSDGSVIKGRCRNGKRHGRWSVRLTDGNRVVGRFEDDSVHGRWRIRDHVGHVLEEATYVRGELQDERRIPRDPWSKRGALPAPPGDAPGHN
ncbi:MAG: hypothetical protein OXI49_03355 [Acidobacteriota bacterium]|nr:hypothetical protein [Acidobacteriota bacterium]